MLQNIDFKIVFDSLSTAFFIAEPMYDERHEITDFTVAYTNRKLSEDSHALFKNDIRLSDILDRLSPEANWLTVLSAVSESKRTIEKAFYSIVCNCYCKAVMNHLAEGVVSVTLINTSQEREAEQQLRRQNARLAALTEELSLSRAGLQKKLNSMQTLNEQLHLAAYRDTMTNLYNRAWLNRKLNESIRENIQFGVLYLNIDNMKNINGAKGHSAGDESIRKVASILHKEETPEMLAFRFDSDEFVLLAQHIETREAMAAIGERLITLFNKEDLGISGGVAIYPNDAITAEDILKYADMAVSESKKNGKNQITLFHPIMQQKFRQKMTIASKLNHALADNLFELYYQPQFDVNSNTLRGFEALLRWHDEDLGWVSPETFIPIAEESRLVVPIGDWVMETAISTLAQWEQSIHFSGILSVNVSPLQFKETSFVSKFKASIERAKINPCHLEIEITEGILIDNFEEILKKLNSIKALGVGISLDDFGTGYSSMRYLQLLPLTTLKIDKSFITNLTEEGNRDTEITESIISLASKMGVDTIAEGVETDEQLNALKHFHQKINVQGFLKGKPMPGNICEKIISGDLSVIQTINDD